MPNANHFWGNCESHRQSNSPNFFGTANQFWPIENHFSNGFAKRPFFGPHTFLKHNFPFFRQILRIGSKNANKLRIMIRNCESLGQSGSQFCDAMIKKWRITYYFLNSALNIYTKKEKINI